MLSMVAAYLCLLGQQASHQMINKNRTLGVPMQLDELYNDEDPVKTLQYHKTLNPKIWVDDMLRPEIRDKLLEISEAFYESLEIDGLKVLDILLTGSNANYNYTSLSDIDLHLKIDFRQLNCDNIAQQFFDAKKALFNTKHNINIKGYHVELYAQDITAQLSAAGVYSVMHDMWIKKPSYSPVSINDVAVRTKADEYNTAIEDIIKHSGSRESAIEVLNDVYKMRKSGLEQCGEFCTENLAFKAVRNMGYLDALKDYIVKAQDIDLSLEHREQTKPALREARKVTGVIYIDGVPEEFTGYYVNYKGRNISRDPKEGPAICWANGNEEYWVNNKKMHTVGATGDRFWFKDGELHREDGPAIESNKGVGKWYKNGRIHRVDGPAIEYPDGKKYWWLNDIEYPSEEEWKAALAKEKVTESKFTSSKKSRGIIYIDGKPEPLIGDLENYEGRNISRDPKEGPAICWDDEDEEYWVNNKKVHVIYSTGNAYWYKDGKIHREDGPAVELTDCSNKWYINGKLHRVDGPAVEETNPRAKKWYLNGKLHREDGPAIDLFSGRKEWYIHGKRHREDGPAIEYPSGKKAWWLNNKKYSEEDWKKEVAKLKNITESKEVKGVKR
jgi:hypothetical protein